GDELAAAIIAAAHARWHAATMRVREAEASLADARSALGTAMTVFEDRDATVAAIASELAGRSAAEAERRAELDAAQARLTELRIGAGSIASELASTERDRRRIADERPAIEAELARASALVGSARPGRDTDL